VSDKAGKKRLLLKLLAGALQGCNHLLEPTRLITMYLAGVWRVERSKQRKILA